MSLVITYKDKVLLLPPIDKSNTLNTLKTSPRSSQFDEITKKFISSSIQTFSFSSKNHYTYHSISKSSNDESLDLSIQSEISSTSSSSPSTSVESETETSIDEPDVLEGKVPIAPKCTCHVDSENHEQDDQLGDCSPLYPPLISKRCIQTHLTGKSKRQRVGPSCDLCKFKKIKCDAYIEVVETNVKKNGLGELDEKCYVSNKKIIQSYLSPKDEEPYELIYSNGKLIKYRNCSYCQLKGLRATFQRGYTKEDILLYNKSNRRQISTIQIKPKKSRRTSW